MTLKNGAHLIRFPIMMAIMQALTVVKYQSQKQLNVAALVLFYVFSVAFSAGIFRDMILNKVSHKNEV